MSHRGLSDVKSEYLEIGQYNFSWPGENGTLQQDFGSINYTMPSGKKKINITKISCTRIIIFSNNIINSKV